MNVFISMGMRNKTDEQIKQEMEVIKMRALEYLKNQGIEEEITFLNSFVNEDAPAGTNPGLWYLGRSIETLAKADFAYFAEGWNNHRGCITEHLCAIQYTIPVFEES